MAMGPSTVARIRTTIAMQIRGQTQAHQIGRVFLLSTCFALHSSPKKEIYLIKKYTKKQGEQLPEEWAVGLGPELRVLATNNLLHFLHKKFVKCYVG